MNPTDKLSFSLIASTQGNQPAKYKTKINGHSYVITTDKNIDQMQDPKLQNQIRAMITAFENSKGNLKALRLTEDNSFQAKFKNETSFKSIKTIQSQIDGGESPKKLTLLQSLMSRIKSIFQTTVPIEKEKDSTPLSGLKAKTDREIISNTLPLADQIISDLLSGEDVQKQVLQKIEDLHQMLMHIPNSDKHFILDKILQKKFGNLLLETLLSNDRSEYSRDKQSLFNVIKQLKACSETKLQRYEGYLNESKEKVFQRKVAEYGSISGLPESALLKPLFLKHEIANISKIKKEDFLECSNGQFLKKSVSENNKIVLHQQAIKSCGQTCVAMLLMDLGFSPDLNKLNGHLTTEDERLDAIEGLAVKEIRNVINLESKKEFLEALQKKIQENGSAIVELNGSKEGRIGAHVMICDAISPDLKTVRVRDPWHGWEVTLHADAFLDAIYTDNQKSYATIVQQLQKT